MKGSKVMLLSKARTGPADIMASQSRRKSRNLFKHTEPFMTVAVVVVTIPYSVDPFGLRVHAKPCLTIEHNGSEL